MRGPQLWASLSKSTAQQPQIPMAHIRMNISCVGVHWWAQHGTIENQYLHLMGLDMHPIFLSTICSVTWPGLEWMRRTPCVTKTTHWQLALLRFGREPMKAEATTGPSLNIAFSKVCHMLGGKQMYTWMKSFSRVRPSGDQPVDSRLFQVNSYSTDTETCFEGPLWPLTIDWLS